MVAIRGHARRWGAYAAFGVAVVLATSGSGLSNPIDHDASGKPATSQRQGEPRQEPQPSPSAAIHGDAQRIAAALESLSRNQQSTADQKEALKDAGDAAKAAQNAAFWAMFLFGAGVAETIVTGVGVYLVMRTLQEAKRSADAGVRAADEMARSADSTRDAAWGTV
jgi:hypothetical protein